MVKNNIVKHLADIDFRTREERSKGWKVEFMRWYEDLDRALLYNPQDPILQGQMMMLSSVLWHLLREPEYKQLRNINKTELKRRMAMLE